MRSFQGADVPLRSEHRPVPGGHGSAPVRDRPAVQHVPRAQRPPAVPAEPAQCEGGRAAEERGDVQAAREQHIGPQAGLGGGADLQEGPAGTVTGSHWATGVPSTVTGAGAPVTHTVVAWVKRSAGPRRVHSRPGAPSSFPSARLPSRKERSSIGPHGGTPTCQ